MKAIRTASPLLASLFLLVVPARADVLTVDPGGGGQYTDLQTAIDDAEDGDTLILAPGSYDGPVSGIVVSDKDLRILGETPRPQLGRDLSIGDLAAGKVVVLSNLEMDARHLEIADCVGSVRVQACVIEQGTSVLQSDDVVFSYTSMTGADGVAGGAPEHGLVVDGRNRQGLLVPQGGRRLDREADLRGQ